MSRSEGASYFNQSQNMTDPITRQFVLKEDGNFYSQTIVEQAIENQNKLLKSIMLEDSFDILNCEFSSYARPPKYQEKERFKYHVATYSQKQNIFYVFVELPTLYFHGANLYKPDLEKESYTMNLSNSRIYPVIENLREGSSQIDFSTRDKTPRWISNESEKLFLMFSLKFDDYLYVDQKAPYLFAYYKELKESYIPNLPNVYDCGRICMGDDYHTPQDSTTLNEKVENAVTYIHNSAWNNDLRASSSFELMFLTFDAEGVRIQQDNYLETAKKFFKPTQTAILDFTSWLNSQQ